MKEIAPNVIMIPPKEETAQEKERKRNLRVAAYCRVSTDDEEQLSSYENQRDYYTDKIINEPGWTMVDVFADEGKTGTSTCSRKDFLRMIRQCRQGKIDMILTKSVSRFARNTVDTLNFTRELRNLGIPVIFEEQNINSIYPESEFLITLYGAFAQSESENTSSRVTWGIRQAMRSGHAHLHYKWLLGYERGPDGKAVIVPEQAETVRFIYQRYLAGDTLRTIKAALEEKGCLTVTGKTEWTPARIQSILTNEKYCGDALLQKTFIQDCISKKVIQNTGQLPKYLIQNHHPAIISREEFDAVQLELARRRARTGGNKKSAPTGRCKYSGKYILSNLLFCGECGTAYRRCVWQRKGYQRVVWRCISRITYGTKYCKHSVTIDYSAMYTGLDQALERNLPQMELYLEIGKLVSARKEKGAAAAAAEYLAVKCPDNSGFSPRNLRRMRDFFRTYETAPDILKEALLIGWTQNVVIMEAGLSMDQRHWYLRAVLQFGWSKAELLRQISEPAHEKMNLDVSTGTCYTDVDKQKQERQDDEDSFCVSWQYLQESDGRVCHEKSGEKGCDGAFVSHCLSCNQSGRNRQSGLSSCPEETGGAWNLLYRPRCPTVDQLRLCRLRFADRYGPGQCPQYAAHFLWRPSGEDPSVDGVCWPTGPRGCRSMVHQRLRGNLERCVGGLPRAA